MNRDESELIAAAETLALSYKIIADAPFLRIFGQAKKRYGSVWNVRPMNCVRVDGGLQSAFHWTTYDQKEEMYRFLSLKRRGSILYMVEPPPDDSPQIFLELESFHDAHRLFMETNFFAQSTLDSEATFLVVENAYRTTIANGCAAQWVRDYAASLVHGSGGLQ